ncbi:hypothetical protein LEMLEM_LOCUS5554 [Lemmus lemmus]
MASLAQAEHIMASSLGSWPQTSFKDICRMHQCGGTHQLPKKSGGGGRNLRSSRWQRRPLSKESQVSCQTPERDRYIIAGETQLPLSGS